MELFGTMKGDKWVCVTCRYEQAERIEMERWEWMLERHDQTLRCSICRKADYEFED